MAKNPFPDYPVTRLRGEVTEPGPILVTREIERARKYAHDYASAWDGNNLRQNESGSLIIPVRGDYGAGKTFLLLDAVAALRSDLAKRPTGPTVLRLSCVEADPPEWYRSEVGPSLDPAMLTDLMARLYASAGERVASEARLTESAVSRLRAEPRFIYTLVRKNLINRTATDGTLLQILREQCRITDENVSRAFACLVWDETATSAVRWLRGETLNGAELGELGVSANLDSETTVTASLTALAAIHSFLFRPFLMLIDELEHLVRYDTVQNGKRNATWLKRLLEGLAASRVLVFIAGHWDAWQNQSDYLDRFSQQRPIDLLKVTSEDVSAMVTAWVDQKREVQFNDLEASTVAELSGGNLRRALSILRALFDASDGFRRVLDQQSIKRLTEEIGQKISIEDAKLLVHELLEQRGVQVQAQADLLGINFDLIGYRAGKPTILVSLKHATTLAELPGEASRFISKIASVHIPHPAVMGLFIADGAIDDQVLSILNTKDTNTMAFDLTSRDVLARISLELDDRLGMGRQDTGGQVLIEQWAAQSKALLSEIELAQRTNDSELASRLTAEQDKVQRQLTKFEDYFSHLTDSMQRQFQELQVRAEVENQELRQRIVGLQSERERSIASVSVAPNASPDSNRLHNTYAELNTRPTLSTKLGYAINFRVVLGISSFVILIVFTLVVSDLNKVFVTSVGAYIALRVVPYLGISVSFIFVLWLVYSRIQRLTRYYDYSARVLREIYIRSDSPTSLIMADNILRSALERYDAKYAKGYADQQLAEAFPETLGYLRYANRDSARSSHI